MPSDESDPPRKFYGLKDAQFDAVNQRSDQQPSIDVNELFRQASGPDMAKPPVPAGPADTTVVSISGIPVRRKAPAPGCEVETMLRENLDRANAAGLNELLEKPQRPSRRKRDYWFLMITGNSLLILLFILAVSQRNAFMMAFSAGGIGLVSAGLTWVMWFVMEDY